MKKATPLFFLMALLLVISSSFTKFNNSKSESKLEKFIVTVNENNDIVNIKSATNSDRSYAWRIIDLSGMTNIRNKPNGKVCMKLKAHVQYEIYANGEKNGWLSISSIYNTRDRYWVRLHSSSTGTYWIAKSILY